MTKALLNFNQCSYKIVIKDTNIKNTFFGVIRQLIFKIKVINKISLTEIIKHFYLTNVNTILELAVTHIIRLTDQCLTVIQQVETQNLDKT